MKKSIYEIHRYLKTKGFTHGIALQFIDGIIPVLIGIKTSYLVDCVLLDQNFVQSFLGFLGYPNIRAIYLSEPIEQTFFVNVNCWKEYTETKELWPLVIALPQKYRNEKLEHCLVWYVNRLLNLERNRKMITVQVPDFTWRFSYSAMQSEVEEVCSITALTGCLLNYGATYHFCSSDDSQNNGLSKEPLNIYRLTAVISKSNFHFSPVLQFSCPVKFQQQVAIIVEQFRFNYQKRWERLTAEEKSTWEEWISFRYSKHALGRIEDISWELHVETHVESSVVL
ncbi:uncharacterized protein SOCG_01567 [Schizosaccharomyces octosporus yFS286]|uniref:Uncharacterized protein n=1 Tax=Schizosaccharomyces octosporus (strain yFS286) TaxID=483514 RepID=S9RB34_SCHOY|nr:uncharacterized protein SOCG_01567 [Schizosaccharomyces octosporus yFS286]EPX71349.1 hypothetical protein SOCG_01567 [Schizosaccharomyces octosporus yFS286]